MCLTPNFIYVLRGPVHEKIPVPCKICWRCKSNRVNDYVGRALCEAENSDWVCSITLTYAPRSDGADKLITPLHAQKFIRSLRRTGHVIRYLVCGEYGKLRGRAHFHVILFGMGKKLKIPNKKNHHVPQWPHGHVFADFSFSEKSMRYVCKYILKDYGDQSWFSLSKNPTIGHKFFMRKAAQSVSLGVIPSSFEYMPPNGHKNRPYLLSGATRRDYIKEIRRLWELKKPLLKSRMSEWVQKAYENLELAECKDRADNLSLKEFIKYLKDRLDGERMSPDAVDRLLKSYATKKYHYNTLEDHQIMQAKVVMKNGKLLKVLTTAELLEYVRNYERMERCEKEVDQGLGRATEVQFNLLLSCERNLQRLLT